MFESSREHQKAALGEKHLGWAGPTRKAAVCTWGEQFISRKCLLTLGVGHRDIFHLHHHLFFPSDSVELQYLRKSLKKINTEVESWSSMSWLFVNQTFDFFNSYNTFVWKIPYIFSKNETGLTPKCSVQLNPR